jgi:hypothetical protein
MRDETAHEWATRRLHFGLVEITSVSGGIMGDGAGGIADGAM